MTANQSVIIGRAEIGAPSSQAMFPMNGTQALTLGLECPAEQRVTIGSANLLEKEIASLDGDTVVEEDAEIGVSIAIDVALDDAGRRAKLARHTGEGAMTDESEIDLHVAQVEPVEAPPEIDDVVGA